MNTREEWLNKVARLMRPMFNEVGSGLPERFRVTMSLTRRAKAIGTCYSPEASADGTSEILIRLDQSDPMTVAAILAHELTHAAVGVDAGHGAPFRRVALAIGLEGKMTATTAGEKFKTTVTPILEAVGPFPHAPLDWTAKKSGPKAQKGRLIKVECQECGFLVRQTRKWIEDVGPAHCPVHGAMAAEPPTE